LLLSRYTAEADYNYLTEWDPWEERDPKVGLYDYWVELHKTINLFYLGHNGGGKSAPYYICLSKKVVTPYDLNGLKMRSGMIYDTMMKAWGIVPVTMPGGEIYTAMQRGIIDGFGWPLMGFTAMGLHEVCPYTIDHPFYVADQNTLANLDSWNNIPKHLQELMIQAAADMERWSVDHYAQILAKDERERMIEKGVEFIKFSPADAKYYNKINYESKWEEAKGQLSPESLAKLRTLLSRER